MRRSDGAPLQPATIEATSVDSLTLQTASGGSRTKYRCRSGPPAPSIRASTSYNSQDSLTQNRQVQPETPALDVIEVHPCPVVEILDVGTPGYLPQACHSRRHCKFPSL